MAKDALKTLFHPFEAGILPSPGAGQRMLFLGAEPSFRPPAGFSPDIIAIQGFRPLYLALQREGGVVRPIAEGEDFDAALVLCGRHRGENELRLAEAITRTKPGGLIVVAGGKEDGVASLRKRLENWEAALAEIIARRRTPPPVIERNGVIVSVAERLHDPAAVSVPLRGHVSKYHGIVFWLDRTTEAGAFANAIREWYRDWPLVEGRFHTAPGMFSHDRVDTGSRLLAENLPHDLSGKIADFCAGWGFLASEVAIRLPKVNALDLYEADFASLEAAKRNLAGLEKPPARFFWHDLAGEKVAERYDAIVMNPPFHTGRKAEPDLGQGMIKAAAAALKSGGRLIMVANRQLPYEKALKGQFAEVAEVAEDPRFKVIQAKR